MSDRSTIEWTDATWNPVTGCTKVSPGCDHCYAETLAERFRGTPGHYFENGFDVQLRPEKLDQPLRWRRPRRVFVNSMSDLFHPAVPDRYIAQIWAVMAYAPDHTFQILTKRHGRMRSLLSSTEFVKLFDQEYCRIFDWAPQGTIPDPDHYVPKHLADGPLPNAWLGVSVEDQRWADIRIPALLQTPAAVRFLSCEPLIGPVSLTHVGVMPFWCIGHGCTAAGCPNDEHLRRHGIDWVIAGGESGRGARVMQLDWARSLRDQCVDAGVPFLFKQWGEWAPAGLAAGFLSDQRDRYGEVVDDGRYPELEWRRVYRRVGKRAAGRELDGRTWDQYPGGAS